MPNPLHDPDRYTYLSDDDDAINAELERIRDRLREVWSGEAGKYPSKIQRDEADDE